MGAFADRLIATGLDRPMAYECERDYTKKLAALKERLKKINDDIDELKASKVTVTAEIDRIKAVLGEA